MANIIRYECGNGEGMFENEKGNWIEHEKYKKLKIITDELFELAYNNCNSLAHDELYEIIEKHNYEKDF